MNTESLRQAMANIEHYQACISSEMQKIKAAMEPAKPKRRNLYEAEIARAIAKKNRKIKRA